MIKASISDREALAALNENCVHAYLKIHGWEIVNSQPYGYLFGNLGFVDDDGECITLHLAKQIARDYPIRLSECLHTLSLVEGRSQLDIFIEMGGDIHYRRT